MIEPGDMHYYQPMWTLVSTNHTFIPDFLLFLIIILCGSWSLPTITLPLYLKLLAPICQLWSVLTTTVHAFVNEFTPSPAGWRRSQKPGSIRPAHGELPSQVGVLEFISHKSYSWKIILQETFLDKYQMFFLSSRNRFITLFLYFLSRILTSGMPLGTKTASQASAQVRHHLQVLNIEQKC